MKLFRSVLLALLLAASLVSSASQVQAASEPPPLLPKLIPLLPELLRLLSPPGAVSFSSLTVPVNPNAGVLNSAVDRSYLKNVALTTPSVNLEITTSNYFLLSFWYNTTLSAVKRVILSAEDPNQATIAELDFTSSGDMLLTLRVGNQRSSLGSSSVTTITFTTVGQGRSGQAPKSPPIQYDGNWHNVIVNAHMTGACLTNDSLPCCLTAEYLIDGGGSGGTAARSFVAVDPQGNATGPTYAAFGPFVWSGAASWTIGGVDDAALAAILQQNAGLAAIMQQHGIDPYYRGLLAEFYLQLDDLDQDPPTPLITTSGPGSIVNKLIQRSPRQAVGLTGFAVNSDCALPTGHVPTMCHTGNPLYFSHGPAGAAIRYILHPVNGPQDDVDFAPSDPCNPALKLANINGCK